MSESPKTSPVSIPPYLADQVRDGRIVLVLGAGASLAAVDDQQRHPPSGKQLSKLIADKFLGGEHSSDPLSSVAEMAAAASNLRAVQRFIAECVSPFSPSRAHLLMPTFRWHGLATINYDELIEHSYDQCKKQLHTARLNGDPIEDGLRDPNGTVLLKLHGCVSRCDNIDIPMIVTPSQYVEHRSGRTRLFETLKSWGAERSIVFCGTTLDDSDLRQLLLEVIRENGERPRYFLVEPFASQHVVRRWSDQRVEVLPATFEQFMVALDSTVTGIARGISVPASDVPLLRKLGVNTAAVRSEARKILADRIDVIQPDLKGEPLDPAHFYRGFPCGWSSITANLDCPRSVAEEILVDCVLGMDEKREADLVVIKAEAGAGKSVLLRRLAWRTGVELNRLAVWATQGCGIDRDTLSEIGHAVKERLYLFVDDVGECSRELAATLDVARRQSIPLTVLVAERTNEWNMRGQALLPYVQDEYEVPRLANDEIDHLIDLLTTNRSLGALASLKRHEQVEAFKKVADRQLLVALHEATQGKPLEEIIRDEYEHIVPESAQSLYLTICLLNRTGTPVRAGLIARVHGIPFEKFQAQFFQPLEHVVLFRQTLAGRDAEYKARHPVIAGMVVEQILADREKLYERIVLVLRHLNTLYTTDQQSFRDLINARTLGEMFPDVQMVRQIYSIAKEVAPQDGHVLFQNALYEMKRASGNLDTAEGLLHQASELMPRNPVIHHASAELEFERAMKATDPLIRAGLLRRAEDQLRGLMGRSQVTAHALHTKCKIELERLRLVLDDPHAAADDEVRAIQHAEDAVTAGLQQFPGDSYILDAESKLAEFLDQHDRALRALEMAAANSLRSATIVCRLVRIYKRNGEREKARELLTKAAASVPHERRYHFETAMLMIEDGGDGEQIERLLRKSFAEGDTNRRAQFLHARQLYVNGKERDARDRFSRLAALGNWRIDPTEARDVWMEGSTPKQFTGRVARVERTFALIDRDGTGDRLFTPMPAATEHPLQLAQRQDRVRFEIAFNVRGPLAVNVAIV
ncbi:MAG: SIR2 family protein [Planctomycetes bacterium]|nr:SIR2 family protein [Planctomycetota bacterium]